MKMGDFIRTDDGLIGKIISEPYEYKDSIGCDIDFGNNDIYNEYEMYQNIIKSSPNIIDLIEVGDYVNGHRVVDKQYHYTDKDNYDMGEWCIFYENVALGDYQYDIKSIVTREMFENMEYKL